ncbi:MAG: family 16 glycosylhydrolase, partial [Caulobacteraceae bacterium]
MTTYYNYLGQAMAVSSDQGPFVNGDPNGGVTITAPPGPSSVSVNGGNYDTLIASQGDNTFYVNNITDVVQAASGLSGIKTIVSYAGGYTLPANVQNLTFYGAGNWGAGNSLGNLIVMGGDEQSTLDGGAGDDVLVGALDAGTDFQFEAGGGHDVFYNFHPALSTVRISGAAFTSFSQIQGAMQQAGSDVVLTVDANDSIIFRNMTIAQFQPRDFLLPLDRSQLGAMTFHDEFSSLQLFSAATGQGQWRADFGDDPTKLDDYAITSNSEKQLYTAPNFKGQDGWDLSAYNPFSIEGGGVLDITTGRFSQADGQHTWGQAYYSGMLNTRGVFMQKYGYFEMRAQLPTDMGSWPALWLVQDPYNGAEADILEHLGMYPDVNFSRVNDAGAVTGHTTYMPALSGFHTYGMLWGPQTTSFYIDDMAVMQVATPASWTKPMYMILDLALGGWGGPIDEAALPAQMKVDWVHVYGLASSPVQVETGAKAYTAPAGVDSVTLIGAGQTVTANASGDALVSNNAGNHLIGGAGGDAITLGGGGDVAAGGGGADSFLVNTLPATASHITDFGTDDRLDLTGLLSSLGYAGADPVADGYLKIAADGSGNAQVWANPHTTGSTWSLVTTLDGVAASTVRAPGGVVTETGGGTGGTGGGGTSVSTSDPSYTAPAGVTDITLTGSQQTVHGNDLGDTFHSNNTGNVFFGGAGGDVFALGRAGDWATGGAGNDIFAFAETPWAGGHITDFASGDAVDLTGLLARSGYTGSEPVGAGYVKITDDGAGDAQIWSDLDQVSPGLGWWLVTTLDHVAPSQVQAQGDLVVMAGSGGAGGTGGTGSTGGTGGGPTAVSTSASPYTAPAGVTDITLTGSQQTVHGNDLGDTFHTNNSGNVLAGGAGNDVFDLGRGGDWATGGGGNDTFAFAETPWAGATITDFAAGQDRMDLTGLLARSGYAGSNAIGDGYIRIVDDSAGDAQVWSNLDKVVPGYGWYLVATLDHVAASSLHMSGAFVTG